MAPIIADEAIANKRKRELDEHGKRKRRRHERTPKKSGDAKEPLLTSEPAAQVNGPEDNSDHEEGMALAIVKSDSLVEKREKRRHRSKALEGSDLKDNIRKWRVSKPIGGRMLNIDPILSDDEKHLILTYKKSLRVYSASESLLLRKIQLSFKRNPSRGDQIAAVCPSATSPNLLWVASMHDGFIWLVDWTTGAGSEAQMALDCDCIHDMFVDSVEIGSSARDILYVSARKGQTWHITAYDVRDLEVVGSKIIYSHTSAIENLRVARLGHIFAAYAERNIILGSRTDDGASTVEDLTYEVVTLDASDEIACLDLQITSRVHVNRRSQREASDTPVVDLVIGCARGAVFAYRDLLPQVRLLNAPKSRHHALQPRKYHWHRKAVHAVKWSRDGNYILSGGSESTLVLWQLDTQIMDFLPHLSATVENIVVSKLGSAYALHLDDNSAMVLTTAEMKPITYISGIQALVSPRPISKDDAIKRIGQYIPDRLTGIPVAISPSDSSRMLLCVGNGQQLSYSGSGPSMPLVQALDLKTMQSVSRQALTRTNPTDVNVTSAGHLITEPLVTGMKYSHDGRWLVTTDEWQPPSRDINSLEGVSSERRETYLKFWSVSADDQSLELMTRIDAPHYSNKVEKVFDLAAHPISDCFATIGGDGTARLWRPDIRQKDGILIQGKKGRRLYSWSCSQAIPLYGNSIGQIFDPDESQYSGAVAFSEDGSVLVCAMVNELESIVQVIDTESGTIRNSLNGLIKGNVQGISILSTNIVVLSDALAVYDLVLDELRYGIQLRKAKASKTEDENAHGIGPSIMAHLATDLQTGRFAVAISRGKRGSSKLRSELAIFSTDKSEPELVHSFTSPVLSLVSSTDSSSFLALDSSAQLWSVAEYTDTKSLTLAQPLADLQLDHVPVASEEEATNTPALLDEGDDNDASGDDMDIDMNDANDDDAIYPAVVAPQRLAELFDAAPSFAMPSIEDMFYQVTKLFSTKTAVSAS